MENSNGPSKYLVLQEFTAVLSRRNPMNLGSSDPLEYESEALSIFSRFVEAALHVPDDEAAIVVVAVTIVRQALEFWFDDLGGFDVEPLARDLVNVYRSAFVRRPRQATSVTLGEEKEGVPPCTM